MDFIFDPGLVLYLPLYKLDASSFMSRDGYGHLCTVTGALWRPSGRYFDGADDIIIATDSAAFRNLTEFTWEMWVYPEDTAGHRMLFTKAGKKYLQIRSDEFISLTIYAATTNGSVFTTDTVTEDAWNHIVVTYSFSGDKKGRIYLNGSECSYSTQNATEGALDADTADLCMGLWYTGGLYDLKGVMGEVRIYNRALTPPEIQHNYLATKWRYQ